MTSFNENVTIERTVYEQKELQGVLEYHALKKKIRIKCKHFHPLQYLLRCLYITQWIPSYNLKQDILPDIIAGFTVAIMHIPQGMAYAMLANCPPIVGIYTAFFPVIVYFLLGTSRHNSMGTFAIICLMVGKVVIDIQHGEEVKHTAQHTAIQIVTAVTFLAGLIQLGMYSLRLGGIISALLSESLVSGFISGSALHVLFSQIKELFGVTIPPHKGPLSFIKIVISTCQEMPNLNIAATIISTVTISIVVINNELFKPRLAKLTIFPVPIELIVVAGGTLISKYFQFNEVYNVSVIGDVPSGIPAPHLPNFEIIRMIILDAIIIAIVSYTISLSLSLIFATKYDYEVDANQELLAMGAGNLVGSFFTCLPVSASLSRSLIQVTVGGKTQLASIISCALLLLVLLWIGPFFEPLPKAVLASVIVVALKGMLVQITAIIKFTKLSLVDGLIWITTFLATVIGNVDIGLLVGIVVSLASIMILGLKPYTCILGSVPNTDLYVSLKHYKKAMELPHIKIFHYCGGINFATKNYFKHRLYHLTGINPQKEYTRRNKEAMKKPTSEQGADNYGFSSGLDIPTIESSFQTKYIILDFTALSYIDPESVQTVQYIYDNYAKIQIEIILAGCLDHVYATINKTGLTKHRNLKCYPRVHDAVTYCRLADKTDLLYTATSL